MSNVVTSQPVSNAPSDYSVVMDLPPPYPGHDAVTTQPTSQLTEPVMPEDIPNPEQNEEEREQRRRRVEEECCCDPYTEDDGFCLYILCRIFCSPCQMFGKALGECTEGCCEGCAECLNNCCSGTESNGDGDCCSGGGCCEDSGDSGGSGDCCGGDDDNSCDCDCL